MLHTIIIIIIIFIKEQKKHCHLLAAILTKHISMFLNTISRIYFFLLYVTANFIWIRFTSTNIHLISTHILKICFL